MKYWIGVISSKISLDRLSAAKESWFCLPKDSEVDDLMFIYASSKASHDRSGFIGTFRISSFDDSKDNLCSCYGGMTNPGIKLGYVNLVSLDFFKEPIKLKQIKSHVLLSKSHFVRKNMQATYFEISAEHYKALEDLAHSA